MTCVVLWLAAIGLPPLLVAALGHFGLSTERLRSAAVACAGISVAACSAIFVVPALRALTVAWPGEAHYLLGDALLRVSEFSAPLVVLPSALWLVTVAVTPRGRLDRAGLKRTALASLSLTIAFLTESPLVLVLIWILSNGLFLEALGAPKHRRVRRVVGFYLWGSAALLCAGIALLTVGIGGTTGAWLIFVAILIRKGIFPFHAWLPEAFENGRLGPAVLFSAPQLGTYVAILLVIPHATPGMLRTVATLSLITAVYGGALAVVQRDARRACGYLFVSQSALVMAGLDCTSVEALAGSLIIWISAALAFAGMTRTVLTLEARRGRLDLGVHHGGYEQMPVLATSFLVLGLACTGFPGTLGFVGEEMLVDGAVRSFPMLGLLVIVTSALTGIAVLRMYFSLFCGRPAAALELRLHRGETTTFAAIAVTLVLAGLAPQPFVESRIRASHTILLRGTENSGRATRHSSFSLSRSLIAERGSTEPQRDGVLESILKWRPGIQLGSQVDGDVRNQLRHQQRVRTSIALLLFLGGGPALSQEAEALDKTGTACGGPSSVAGQIEEDARAREPAFRFPRVDDWPDPWSRGRSSLPTSMASSSASITTAPVLERIPHRLEIRP